MSCRRECSGKLYRATFLALPRAFFLAEFTTLVPFLRPLLLPPDRLDAESECIKRTSHLSRDFGAPSSSAMSSAVAGFEVSMTAIFVPSTSKGTPFSGRTPAAISRKDSQILNTRLLKITFVECNKHIQVCQRSNGDHSPLSSSIFQQRLPFNEPGGSEGPERRCLKEEDRANTERQIRPVVKLYEEQHQSHGPEDHDAAACVDAVSPDLHGSHHVALRAHSEEHQAENRQRREEQSGKSVVRQSDMLLERRGALIRRGGTKGHAQRKNPGQDSRDFIPHIVAAAK